MSTCKLQLKFFYSFQSLSSRMQKKMWLHDIHHNDTQHNDTQHNDTQHNDIQDNNTQHNDMSIPVINYDTQHNDIHHNDIQHNNTKMRHQHNDTKHKSLIILMPSVFHAEHHN